MKKPIITILIALIMVFTVAITTFAAVAEDDLVAPCATYIGSTDTTFSVNTFSCGATGEICGRNGAIKVNIKLQLQKENDGVWTTVKTWEKTFDSYSGALEGTATISPFSTYRLKATYTAYTSSDSESFTVYRYE